jgi:hypothetical protein
MPSPFVTADKLPPIVACRGCGAYAREDDIVPGGWCMECMIDAVSDWLGRE